MKNLWRYEKILNSVVLKTIMIFVVVFLLSPQAGATEPYLWNDFTNEEIVSAIGKTENSVKQPYGIKSIDTKGNKEYAKQICLNSVHNGRARWIKAGKPDDLIVYIGLRYCPPTAHKLNSNWVKNVKFHLYKGGK